MPVLLYASLHSALIEGPSRHIGETERQGRLLSTDKVEDGQIFAKLQTILNDSVRLQ